MALSLSFLIYSLETICLSLQDFDTTYSGCLEFSLILTNDHSETLFSFYASYWAC